MEPEAPVQRSEMYVVGIGASAGGLQAIELFFDNLPAKTGMAFVVVQHLSPDFKSLMDELLARHTDLPIRLVEDGMPLEPDHVYLIPPKKEMIVSGGRLLLSERDRQRELTLPIDVFFRSLAQDLGRRAIAIVLSGGGSDGSRGIRDVHDARGLVIVQDADTAQFDGMPRAANDAGVAHWVLPPQDMPRVIIDYVRAGGQHPPEPVETAPEGLAAVYRMLENEYGIDFTHYKPSTVTRRIERRLRLAHDAGIGAYVDRLRGGREELDMLYHDLLIGVTRFFRDPGAFQLLEEQVLPQLLQGGPQDVPLRVWVAGCATGEEAYSLAILLHEVSARLGSTRAFKIFATDVHRGSLETAARAVYDNEALTNVSAERLARFFQPRGSSHQVVPDLRQHIVFAPHNVIKDAPFTRVDLVTCRNMLIYLQPAAQHRVLSLFHFALTRGGVVFLGPSESPGPLVNDFEIIDKHWRLYRKHTDVRIPIDSRLQPRTGGQPGPAALPGGQLARHSLSQLLGTYDALLADFMPPSLLISDRGELVHSFGGASRFLRVRDGRQGLEALDFVVDELKMVLAGGLQRALKSTSAIVFNGVPIRVGDQEAVLRVSLRRILPRRSGQVHVLVTFEETEAEAVAARPQTEIHLDQLSREQLSTLQSELSHTKENLQAAIEELEASNEELQASNEELQASNEELQSTNEELQSVNEELYTVNAEYQRKISELTELTNDVDNLLSSTDIGTIFVDGQLRIRKFIPQIAHSFNLLPQDIGRSIETFQHTIDMPDLGGAIRAVIATAKPLESEVRDGQGRAFFLRILPYRAKGTVQGAVITLIDVSALKAAEDALFHERYLLNSLLGGIPDAIYFRDAGGRIIRANRPMAARLGIADPTAAEGKSHFELTDHATAIALHRQDEEVLRSGEAQHYRIEQRTTRDGVEEWDLTTRLPLTDDARRIVGLVSIFRDITKQVRAEHASLEAVRRRDQFLAMLSHELRNPLSAMMTASTLLRGTLEAHDDLRYLGVFDRQLRQMARLLDDLLDTSRVTQNKIELHRRVVDLRMVAREAVDAVQSSLPGGPKNELTVNIASHPVFVEGDPARLQQIHVNLLNNALKYTPPGGHVSLEVTSQGGQAIIRVRDDGVGIAKPMQESVFELFVQSNRTLDRSQGGIGVGLTLVRSLVTLHGGTVTLDSEGEGKGCLFTVRLPQAQRTRRDTPGQPRPPVLLDRGAHIVVVEDNADSRQMLCELLQQRGFRCHTADDGLTGLELVTSLRPAVAIIDVGLPGLDGFELARRVRRDSGNAAVYLIALTGYGQVEDRAHALHAGFDEHLVKPVNAEDLVHILVTGDEARLDRARAERRPELTG